MVDFAKARAAVTANLAASKAAPVKVSKPLPPTQLERINHIVTFHLGEISEWESNFLYNNIEWLKRRSGNFLSEKADAKLVEIEDQYCGKQCLDK